MEIKLINKVIQRVTVDYCRLSIVGNQDGFLANAAVRTLIYQQTGIEVITGSNLNLRVHFELNYKASGSRFIYVCDSVDTLLPDMREQAYITDFSISDIFPLFADKSLLKRQSYEVLEQLYEQYGMKRVAMTDGLQIVGTIIQNIEDKKSHTAEAFRGQLKEIDVDWSHQTETISSVSKVLVSAIKAGIYDGIATVIDTINETFQNWVNAEYFATLQSSPLLKAKSVNKILPYISAKYSKNDKVALFVVDCFAFWQYTILKDFLKKEHLTIDDGSTLAWLPSITMLSRQAIFRGADPLQDYKQSPENERKLWLDYWKMQGFGRYEVQYIYDTDDFAINDGVKRLAVVTVEMDEKMHSSTNYKDLCSLTENWSQGIVDRINVIANAGYTIYLTTDHGSVLSQGCRLLTSEEKVFLYKDGSRGMRHLIYNDRNERERFCKNNSSMQMITHDNWLALRDNSCFAKEKTSMITHGGSHFLEMVIPLIKIKK